MTAFANRASCNVAPVIWNSLPHHLTDDLSYPASFRRNLKTHFYKKSFHCHATAIRHVASSTAYYYYQIHLHLAENRLVWRSCVAVSVEDTWMNKVSK